MSSVQAAEINPIVKLSWKASKEWDEQSYSDALTAFVQFIDSKQVVTPEFINRSFDERLTVCDAIEALFSESGLTVKFYPEAIDRSGLFDIDISGIESVSRVVVPMDISRGNTFNIYYGVSSKGGCIWRTDLKTSLKNFFKKIEVNDVH